MIIGTAGKRKLKIPISDILQHQHVIGATGTGKSTFLANQAVQAFEEGACCVVIDPHGDLALDILRAVNPGDLGKVYFLDPVRVRFSLNPLELPAECHSREIAVERMIGEITEFFRKFYGRQYWGPSLNRIFQEGLRALYEKDDAPTLGDLYDLVSGRIRHEEFEKELKKLPRGRTDAVLNKLAPFVRNRFLSRILCSKPASVRIEELMKPGSLVIFRLSRGEISEAVSSLLGSAIITQTWLHAISRESRFLVILFIDELQIFSHLETLCSILSEGRKYAISLVAAHQHLKQLPEKLLNDLLGNAGMRVVFRVSGEDARTLARALGNEDISERLISLSDGRAVVWIRGSFREVERIVEISTLPLIYRNPFSEHATDRMRKLFEIPEREEEFADPEIYELLHILLEKSMSMSEIFEKYRKILPGVKASYVSALVERVERLGFVKRNVVKQRRGRPKIVVELSEKAVELLDLRHTSRRAGGELHSKLAKICAERLRKDGCAVIFPPQAGREEQPDMIAYKRSPDGWEEIAVEIETRADHPEQVMRNYKKNIRKGRKVIFVVPDERIAERVRKILGDRDYTVEVTEYF
ncbi:type IV secretory system conjugative DNA transfer family protein [Ferroglobus placidus]|uniref:type IV secretory system conjugative DNA transfer family protein n=1 Tax=Ferroglobus placidus TaxID=54261 RepID=UPI0001B74319|nr:type IV secretion system DNA-binding domain-containing protein [Ferroglobus placidus]